jgi:hypothetical protein
MEDDVMKHALIFDCEFLTAEGAPSRFWCGPFDPDPVVAQIGVVKIGLTEDFPLLDTLNIYVVPRNRFGERVPLDPLFTRLTGITEEAIEEQGVTLTAALEQTSAFASGAKFWSWGKDEFNMIAISCYVEGLQPPIPATQFGNACQLLLKAGMPYDDIKQTRSNTLADYYQLDHPPLRGHDALDDARSVAYVVQHLLRQGLLKPVDCI